MEFRSDVCWYLDSQFCQGFHDWKFIAGSTAARVLFNIFFFAAYGIVFYHVLKGFAVAVKKYSKLHDRLLTETGVDADGDGLDDVTFVARVETFFAILAEFSYRGMMMRLFLLMLPWPFWSAVGDCWDCYDLEAATAHHVATCLVSGTRIGQPQTCTRISSPRGRTCTILSSQPVGVSTRAPAKIHGLTCSRACHPTRMPE